MRRTVTKPRRSIDSIRRWHWGKLVILWSWGGIVVAFLLGEFLRGDPQAAPGVMSATLLAGVVTLLLLSALTWIWLGGKDSRTESEKGK